MDARQKIIKQQRQKQYVKDRNIREYIDKRQNIEDIYTKPVVKDI